jgi:membrane-bound lytic murein transglycosylase MltF
MPFLERIRTLFSRKGETEKKIALLSERRAALSQQRDRSYEDLSALEAKESELRQQFKDARAPLTKRRVTSQLLQLQKEMERRQQMLGVFNQQIDVVSTHLHNLELVRQGQSAKLPDSEELTDDAVKAEEMLAQLQADTELAGTVAQSATAGLSAEEQALYDELERESSQPASPQANSTPAQSTPAQRSAPVATPPAAAATKRPASSEPEAG